MKSGRAGAGAGLAASAGAGLGAAPQEVNLDGAGRRAACTHVTAAGGASLAANRAKRLAERRVSLAGAGAGAGITSRLAGLAARGGIDRGVRRVLQ